MTTLALTRPPGRAEPAPIPFRRLLRAEWLKTTGTRAARRRHRQRGRRRRAQHRGRHRHLFRPGRRLQPADDPGQTFGWMLAGQWSGHGAQIATSAVLWIAVPLTVGWVRTIRREVR